MPGRPTLWRAVVVLAFLLASLAGGPARVALPVDPALAAFYAMGGTPDDLCGGGVHGSGGAHCDACRPVGAPPMPGPYPGAERMVFAGTLIAWRAVEVAEPGIRFFEPSRPRAPPVG